MRFAVAVVLAAVVLSSLVGVAAADEGGEAPAAGAGVTFESDPGFSGLLEKAKATGKPILLVFATDCPSCRKLATEAFSRADVGEATRAFVAARIDAEDDERPALEKHFQVFAYPTLLVVDTKGEEVDRILGYRTPADFVAEVKRIASGEGTIPALRKKVAADPDDLASALLLAEKEEATKSEASTALYGEIAKKAKAKGDRELEAAAVLKSMGSAHIEDALPKFLGDYAGTKAAGAAAAFAVRILPGMYRKRPEALLAALEKVRASATDEDTKARIPLASAQAYRLLAEKSLRDAAKAAGDRADRLDDVARYAHEHKLLVKEATAWATKAVELSKRDPMILGTLASLRADARAYDEAIAIGTEAAKGADGRMKAAFEKNIAAWTAAKAGKALEIADEDGDDDEGKAAGCDCGCGGDCGCGCGGDDDDDDDAKAPAGSPKPASRATK